MTAPVEMPIYGKIQLRRTTKEALLELWEEVVQKTGVAIEAPVKVNGIVRGDDGLFAVDTSTAFVDAMSAVNVRSAYTTNGTDIWVTGNGGTSVTGVAIDVDGEGRLVVDQDGTPTALAAGDVTHVR